MAQAETIEEKQKMHDILEEQNRELEASIPNVEEAEAQIQYANEEKARSEV